MSGNTSLPKFGDSRMLDLINRLEAAITALEAHPLAGLLILTGVPVVTGGRRTYHGLGFQARGAFIVRAEVDVRIAVSPTPDAVDPSNWFFLSASANATIDLAVF